MLAGARGREGPAHAAYAHGPPLESRATAGRDQHRPQPRQGPRPVEVVSVGGPCRDRRLPACGYPNDLPYTTNVSSRTQSSDS